VTDILKKSMIRPMLILVAKKFNKLYLKFGKFC
jgi:hypothetical protein